MEFLTLSNGNKLPTHGTQALGLCDDDKADKTVISAAQIGYRHIVSRKHYGNERGIGIGTRTVVLRERNFLSQAR